MPCCTAESHIVHHSYLSNPVTARLINRLRPCLTFRPSRNLLPGRVVVVRLVARVEVVDAVVLGIGQRLRGQLVARGGDVVRLRVRGGRRRRRRRRPRLRCLRLCCLRLLLLLLLRLRVGGVEAPGVVLVVSVLEQLLLLLAVVLVVRIVSGVECGLLQKKRRK